MDNKIKPIKPNEVIENKKHSIPDIVFLVFNELITENFNGNYAYVNQKEAVKRIISYSELQKQEIFDKHYLDIEDIYREFGWKVKYDKPGYNESYDAYFMFYVKK